MPRFVIHEHLATKAGKHYDLRLEVGNKLYSFACRKGIPEKVNEKRLIIKQPDHDKKWLNFEGELKSGYGKGILKIWDKGTYKFIKHDNKVMVLEFYGNKIKGKYNIIKLEKNNYLIFKSKK